MGCAVTSLMPLYQLPIEQNKSKPLERTWYGREVVNLLDCLGDGPQRDGRFEKAPAFASSAAGAIRSEPLSPAGLPSDPSLLSEEVYVRRVGFDRFLLSHGDYFNLNAEIPVNWHDLRSLVSGAA